MKLDETAEKEPKDDTEALLEETGEFKAFVEAKVKSAVKSLFADLHDLLDGKTEAIQTSAPANSNASVEDVEESFDKLFPNQQAVSKSGNILILAQKWMVVKS